MSRTRSYFRAPKARVRSSDALKVVPHEIFRLTVQTKAELTGNTLCQICTFTDGEVHQNEEASKEIEARFPQLAEVDRSTFPLPSGLAEESSKIREEIALGFAVLRGLPVQLLDSPPGLDYVLGHRIVCQNELGHMFGYVKDLDVGTEVNGQGKFY